MKTFLQHDISGFFYQRGNWVPNLSDAHAFSTVEDAERVLQAEHITPAHTVSRLDPGLMQRFLARPPGAYQPGE